jgi:hypothetical protein
MMKVLKDVIVEPSFVDEHPQPHYPPGVCRVEDDNVIVALSCWRR